MWSQQIWQQIIRNGKPKLLACPKSSHTQLSHVPQKHVVKAEKRLTVSGADAEGGVFPLLSILVDRPPQKRGLLRKFNNPANYMDLNIHV